MTPIDFLFWLMIALLGGIAWGIEAGLAARHRNPAGKNGFLAAVVNHSGYLFINQQMSRTQTTYDCQSIPDCMYGASYCSDPFAWRRADVLDLGQVVCPGSTWGGATWPATIADVSCWTSQIHNLARSPVRTYHTIGETDELGYRSVVNPVQVRDLHATMLHLCGIDHTRLSMKFQGLDLRLTGVEPARVVREVLA